jgi:hypothetical protein
MRAEGYLSSCLERLVQESDTAVALMELAISCYYTKRKRKARSYARRSLEHASRLGVRIGIAESLPEWERDVLPKLVHST